MNSPQNEKGAALLTVLLLVAVMAVIAATALDRLKLSTRLAANAASMAQARAYGLAVEAVATTRLEDLQAREPGQTTLKGDWLNRDIAIPVDDALAYARLSDAGNCFNLNSLVVRLAGSLPSSGYTANAETIDQFVNLMILLQVPKNDAMIIAQSAADWIDSDAQPLPAGAEDNHYRGLDPSFLPSNQLMVDRSELRAVKGMNPIFFNRIKNWICTIPVAEPTKINVNTLSPDQSILLSMLFADKLSPGQAKAYLAKRPIDGYGSLVRFWSAPVMAALNPSAAVQGQVQLKSKYYHLQTRISSGEIELESRALIDASRAAPFVLQRSFGDAG